MKKCTLWVVLGFVLILSLTACSGKTVEITEEMNGQTITLKQGETLVLSLAGNPTTGYNWEVDKVDQTILALQGEAEYESDSELIGSGGAYTFKFGAEEVGTTTLKLKYYRSFETDVPPVETFEITVEVN
jgi:inhibitor of cysteine peptidase